MEKTGDKSIALKKYKIRKNKFKPKRKLTEKETEKEAAEKHTYMDDFSSKFK